MKNKFLLILILTSVLSATIFAQTYRLEMGYLNQQRFGTSESTSNFNGIRLGGTAEFKLKNNFSLLTGALYSVVYSNKTQNYIYGDSVTYSTYGHYIDVPIRLTFTYHIANYLKVFGFAGPNISIGIAQPQKVTAVLSNELKTMTGIESGNYDLYKNAIINRMNFQLGAGGGVQYKNYQLKSGYDFGIHSINAVDTGTLRQGGWYISFSYQF
jgi:hypothetical protein